VNPNLPQNPEPFRKAFAYRRRRAFFSFRRKSDLAWFIINICLFVFSLRVIVFKVKFEPPMVIEKIVEKREIHQIPPTPDFAPAPAMPEGGTIVGKPEAPPVSPTKPIVQETRKEPARVPEPPKRTEPPFKAPPMSPYNFLQLDDAVWQAETAKKGKMSVVGADTDSGRIIRFAYDMGTGSRVAALISLQFDLSVFKKLQVNYTLAEGRPGAVELVISDAEGGELRVPLERAADGQWHRTEVPILKNAPVDWRRVKRVAVVMSLNPKDKNPQAPKGTFWINQLRTLS
jgi:hypothetical protein